MSEVLFFEYLRIQEIIDRFSDVDDIERVTKMIRELEENHKPIFRFFYSTIMRGHPKHHVLAELELTAYNEECYTVVEKIRYWGEGREFITVYKTCNLQNVIKGIAGILHQHFAQWEHFKALPMFMSGEKFIKMEILRILFE